MTISFARWTPGTERSKTQLTTVKIAVLALIPSASVSIQTREKAGVFRNPRRANLMSWRNESSIGKARSSRIFGRRGPYSCRSATIGSTRIARRAGRKDVSGPTSVNRAPNSRPAPLSIPTCSYPCSAIRSTRPITPLIRSQFSASAASRFRPLFVIE